MPTTFDNRDTDNDSDTLREEPLMIQTHLSAIENRLQETQKALDLERARFSALVRLQKDVAHAGLDCPRVMRLVAKSALELTRAQGAAIRTRVQGKMTCRAASGTAEELIGDSIPLFNPIVQALFADGGLRYYPDYQSERLLSAASKRHANTGSLLLVPLHIGTELAGLLSLSSSETNAFPDCDIETAEFLAGLIATTMCRCAEEEAKQALLSERAAALTHLEESRNLYESSINSMHEGYVLLDASGKIISCNSSAIRILEISEEELIGRKGVPQGWQFIRSDGTDFPRAEHPSQIALSTGVPQVNVLMGMKWPNAWHRWLSVNAAPVYRAEDKKPYAVVVTFNDVTERQRDEIEMARLASIVQSSEDGISSIDLDGRIVTWNKACERSSGIRAEAAIGQHVSHLVPPRPGFNIEEDLIRMMRGEVLEPLEITDDRADGAAHHLLLTISPIKNAYGALIGASAIVRDVTHIKQQQLALRRSEERLAEAQRIAKIGSWDKDMVSGAMFWSDEMYRLFEFDPAAGLPSQEEIFSRYHPEDLAARDRTYEKAIETGSSYQFDVRLILPSGVRRKCHAVAVPELDGHGKVIRIAGTMMDITERDLSEERFRVLFEESSDAHLLFSDNGIIDCNNATLGMLRCADKSQILALHPAVLSPEFQPDGRRSDEKSIEMDARAREHGYNRFEWIHRKMDGEEFPVEVTLTPVFLGGNPVLLVVWHDLTERVKAEQQLKDYAIALEFQMAQLAAVNAELAALATTDGLTGLNNHRTFQERLGEEVSRAARYRTPLTALMLDVDNFKQYNDAFGHPEGDEVLRQVARLLKLNARETDTAARYGGEEFAMILPETDIEGAKKIAERIRRAIEKTAWPLRPVTASIGIATFKPGIENSGSLVSLADAALYESKSEGRNRVTVK